MRAESEGQEAGPVHKGAATNLMNVGVVLGSVNGTVLLTGADTDGEVSVLPGCNPIIDTNLAGSGLAISSEKLSAVHPKGKMVEYGNVCSLKPREWKRLAWEKARNRGSEVNPRVTKRALNSDLEDGMDTKICKNAGATAVVGSSIDTVVHSDATTSVVDSGVVFHPGIVDASCPTVAAPAEPSVTAVVALDAAGISLAVAAPSASGAAVPSFSSTGSRQLFAR
ncbi:hypothetical protein ACOSQ3_014541 [Xanthoceras sorbifolium]